MTSEFKNVLAILDNDFGSLRIIKDHDNRIFINDVDLTKSSKTLIESLAERNLNLYLLIRENEDLDSKVYEQIDTFLTYDSAGSNIVKSIPFNDNLKELLVKLEKDFFIKPSETIFISSDRSSRHISIERGYSAVPHPKIVNMIVNGKSFNFVRILTTGSSIARISMEEYMQDILPYYFEIDNDVCELIAIISDEILHKAIEFQMNVQVFKVDIAYEDIINVNLDISFTKDLIKETTTNYRFLLLDNHKMLITVGEKKIANIPLHGRHGHFIQLIPDDFLLYKFRESVELDYMIDNDPFKKAINILKNWPVQNIKFKSIDVIFSHLENLNLEPINPNFITRDIRKYSGVTDLNLQGKIESRHCLHPDNKKAVLALESDLKQMGYYVKIWEFQADSRPPGLRPDLNVEGATFYNVIAELPGMGSDLFLKEDISSKVRDIFLKYPNPLQDESWIYDLRMLFGDEWFENNDLQSLNALDLKRRIEEIFGLSRWSNWWAKDKDKPGLGSEIIVIGCHLDSTANLHRDQLGNLVVNKQYDPKVDKAPGADDDGSGLAAILELARIFSKLKYKLRHTIQFCFFNAEEVGLRGSLEYAKFMRRLDAPIAAVICMDMIGYNKDKRDRTFEIHAGHNNSKIRDISVQLAKHLEISSQILGKLGEAQIYKGLSSGTGEPDEGDRDKYDGAIQRSDHWSFQTHGYPSVVVSEDLFINIPNIEYVADSNPQYHQITDKDVEIDQSYIADIASMVALTILKIDSI